MSEKKTLLQRITGTDEIPIKVDFTPYGRTTLFGTAAILAAAALAVALIAKRSK